MATDVRAVLIKLVGQNDTKKAFASFNKSLKSVKAASAQVAKFSAGVMAGAVALTVKAVKAASNYNEVLSKFDTVFKEQAESARAWSEEFARSVGLSQRAALQFMAGMQDLFVPLGFARKEATKFSKQVVQLAVDLASFNNMRTEDVVRDIQAALTGSGETMKKYGVIVSQTAIKQELLNMGIKGGTQEATNQQKAQAALNIIMRGTTDAQGDAIRTSSSWANTMKSLKAEAENLAVAIGNELVPELKGLLSSFRDLLRDNAEGYKESIRLTIAWVKENEVLIKSVVALTLAFKALQVTGIGALLLSIPKLIAAAVILVSKYTILYGKVLLMAKAYGAFKIVLAGLIAPVVFLAAKIAAVTAAVYGLYRASRAYFENFAPGAISSVSKLILGLGEALGIFEDRMSNTQLNAIATRNAERQREQEKSQPFGFIDEEGNTITREQAVEKGLLEESRDEGKGVGAALRMAVKENNDAMREGILEEMRSGNTQLAGATLAGGNGI